jgi:hypothetical protein
LPAFSFAIRCTFYDTWEIEELDFGIVVIDDAWNTG